jgi:hypothetical protein
MCLGIDNSNLFQFDAMHYVLSRNPFRVKEKIKILTVNSPVFSKFVRLIRPAVPCLDLRYIGLSSRGQSSSPASQSSLLILLLFFLFFFLCLSSSELESSDADSDSLHGADDAIFRTA